MLTVNLRYTGENGAALAFAKEMTASGTVDAIRAEEGNIRYEYYISLNDPQTVLLIDSWRDQAAIDAHHASPMMKTIASVFPTFSMTFSARSMTSCLDSIWRGSACFR